ncbi:sensor histidine kinase [Nonomuraea rhodomycinica]|uniref:histidine kinase n=1 Tax=Nonomuraea rhodomycinica TaxID=1712872 RepID=A0A7Y6MAB3_9ACTN|nr:histidine kinase [Nonomuraea rhodomycinica]NUW40472.1 hypothetical protein [Nonomuraea rhodomycinica]
MHEPNPLFARRLSRGQLVMLDMLAGLCFSFLFLTAPTPIFDVPWARLAVSLGLGLPLALRRVWPVPVFCLVLTVSVAAVVLGVVSIAYVAPAYALYMVALTDDRGALAPTMAIAVLTLITFVGLVAMGGSPHPNGPSWFAHLDVPLLGIAALGGSWTVGRAVRERRMYAARDAERLAERKVTEERLRIARELHDVVTHSVGLIAVKAGVANHVMRNKPEEAHDALKVIETVSRSALVEMRHLLGVLRSDDHPDRGPLPRLTGIGRLAERARLAGVEVELDLRFTSSEMGADAAPGGGEPARWGGSPAAGENRVPDVRRRRHEGPMGPRGGGSAPESRCAGPGYGGPLPDGGPMGAGGGYAARQGGGAAVPGEGSAEDFVAGGSEGGGRRERGSGERRLPEGVELSTYRIVQEALTNVAKHAAPTRCRVSVVAGSSEVRIEVTNDRAAGRGVAVGSRGASMGNRDVPTGRSAEGRDVPTGSRSGGSGRVGGEPAMEGAGHGLIGMRERVAMFGGAFEAGPVPGGGFRVLATLPYGSAP